MVSEGEADVKVDDVDALLIFGGVAGIIAIFFGLFIAWFVAGLALGAAFALIRERKM